ncbi:2,3-dihydroxyphenylpropionate 1,2-dioxygenase [Cryptosporangium phraense]|uniref:2,3-dihydroxyphenylpropionate 1,2-dioxygenase n=1 Tax=Cryptosporangium phraense TaxID=2593070 RepID=A0A545AQX1_9ACTN|nr:2,3-dihydroxyphenylpropionate 1,2-dioxygenase [Cryptosporangium phraense]TQS43683.1 2,3-dihydroxyphenylpropionate 1,2-dioxygenase [Cryptosporangium phraense]
MSSLLGLVALSHSPFAALLPPSSPSDPGAEFLGFVARLRAAVARLAPDAVVVLGPDHFHANFYDVMPPFLLGVENVVGFGDYGSTPGPLPVERSLAWALHGALADAGFDLSLSYSLTVDHGTVQSYEMVTGSLGVPLVPLVVNTAAPPLPSLARCVALGQALGDAIRAADFDGRVLLVASGGLSHWLPSNDPRDPAVVGARREALIHGRADAVAFAAAREPKVRAMGGNPTARVNADWDRWFLKQLSTPELGPVVELGTEGLEKVAGSGGQEIRTWLIGHAACGEGLAWAGYEPVPEWITGMACAATFVPA